MGDKVRFIGFIGLFAVIYAWIVILTCISINPWFVFTEHAFSDLGAPTANSPWLYNYGMISIGVLIIIYSIYLAYFAENKLMTVGAAFSSIAGIFLMLVGLYPSGTRPHVFVSTYFFLQFDLAIIIWSLGAYRVDKNFLYLSALLVGLAAPFIGFLVPWPSAATVEAFGVIVIDYWVIVSFVKSMRS